MNNQAISADVQNLFEINGLKLYTMVSEWIARPMFPDEFILWQYDLTKQGWVSGNNIPFPRVIEGHIDLSTKIYTDGRTWQHQEWTRPKVEGITIGDAPIGRVVVKWEQGFAHFRYQYAWYRVEPGDFPHTFTIGSTNCFSGIDYYPSKSQLPATNFIGRNKSWLANQWYKKGVYDLK